MGPTTVEIVASVINQAVRLQDRWWLETRGTEYMPDLEAVHFAYVHWCERPDIGESAPAGAVLFELRNQLTLAGRYILHLSLAEEALRQVEASVLQPSLPAFVKGRSNVLCHIREGELGRARQELAKLGSLLEAEQFVALSRLSRRMDWTLRAEETVVDWYWKRAGGCHGAGRVWQGRVNPLPPWHERANRVLLQAQRVAVQAGLDYLCGPGVTRVSDEEAKRWSVLDSAHDLTMTAIAARPQLLRPEADVDHAVNLVRETLRNQSSDACSVLADYLTERICADVPVTILAEPGVLRSTADRELGRPFVSFALQSAGARAPAPRRSASLGM